MLAIAPKSNLVRAFAGRAVVVIEPSMAAVDSIDIPKDSTIRVRQHGEFWRPQRQRLGLQGVCRAQQGICAPPDGRPDIAPHHARKRADVVRSSGLRSFLTPIGLTNISSVLF